MNGLIVAKVDIKDGKTIGLAENMEWNLYSPNGLVSGDYVYTYALNNEDDGDFYLEDAKMGLATKKEWEEQEENFK